MIHVCQHDQDATERLKQQLVGTAGRPQEVRQFEGNVRQAGSHGGHSGAVCPQILLCPEKFVLTKSYSKNRNLSPLKMYFDPCSSHASATATCEQSRPKQGAGKD